MRKIPAAAVLLWATAAGAALPPWYDQAAIFELILQDEATAAQHRMMPLRRIEELGVTQSGLRAFEVETQECRQELGIRTHSPGHPGPTRYEIAERGPCR